MIFSKFLLSAFLSLLFFYHFTGCKNQPVSVQKHTESQQEKLPGNPENRIPKSVDTTHSGSRQNNIEGENADDLMTAGDLNEEEKAKPKGYVIKNNTVMYEEDNTRAKPVATLSKGESVFLMETSLADENGQLAGYPTWYKVQLSNKKTGWIESSRVSFGH